MPLLKDSSDSSNECDNSLILEYAEREARQLVESCISEAASHQNASAEPKKLEKKNFLEYICDLHDKLTLRSIMTFLGLYVLVLTFQVIFQLDDRLFRRAAAPPRPFFRESAREVLTDYYTGNGASPAVLLRKSEIPIVCYYAPWSLESRQTRPVFEQVARSFKNESQLSFSAVNCFSAQGQCRITYKAHMFPVIVAYVGRTALMYNGEITADFLHRWIVRIKSPMTRLNDREDVAKFLSEHDYAVIAYFSMKTALKRGSRFRQYVISSVYFAQYDHLLDNVAFAVVTNPVTGLYMRFGYDSQVRLYHWHRGVDYSHERNYTGPAIAEWIRDQSNDSQLVQWIIPDPTNMGKTEQLHSILSKAPTILLFTNREPLYDQKSDFSLVSQTALEYYACDENLIPSFRIRATKLEEFRRRRFSKMNSDRQSCNQLSPIYLQVHDCCSSAKKALNLPCHMCHVREIGTSESLGSCFAYDPFHRRRRLFASSSSSCQNIYTHLSDEQVLNTCCLFMSSSSSKRSPHAKDKLLDCERYKLAQKLHYQQIFDDLRDESVPFDSDAVFGLSCKRNQTLRFAAVDQRHQDYWAERLSLPAGNGTVVALVNLKTESISLMQEAFSRKNFRNFIRQFHYSLLGQHHVTEKLPNFLPPLKAQNPSLANKILVRKTTMSRFEKDILNSDSKTDVVLFFSGGNWHGPSTSVYYIYHTAAHYFKQFFGVVQFFMIDVSKNELSWPYKMEKLPAVLFFPANRKANSATFPTSVPFTVPNLVAFILAHCQTELRWRVALSSCSQLCVHRNKLRLHRHATVLSNDLAALQRLAETYAPKRYSSLIGALIKRRRAQLRVTRKLLALLRSLNALTSKQLQNEAASMVQQSISLQSLFEYPLSESSAS